MNSPQPDRISRATLYRSMALFLVLATGTAVAGAGEVVSLVARGNFDEAIDLVFVAAGFTENQLPLFRAEAERLVSYLRTDPRSFLPGFQGFFNFHLVLSPDPWPGVGMGAALPGQGTWVTALPADNGVPVVELEEDHAAVYRRALAAPDVDCVVVIYALRESSLLKVRRSAKPFDSGRIVRLPLDNRPEHFLHELAHALFNLGDEYALPGAGEFPAARGPGLRWIPNLSLPPAPGDAPKWNAVAKTFLPGGEGYERGIGHATVRCLMNRDTLDAPFCEVCRAAIGERLEGRIRGEWRWLPPPVFALSPRILAGTLAVLPWAPARGWKITRVAWQILRDGLVLRQGEAAPEKGKPVLVTPPVKEPGRYEIRVATYRDGETAGATAVVTRVVKEFPDRAILRFPAEGEEVPAGEVLFSWDVPRDGVRRVLRVWAYYEEEGLWREETRAPIDVTGRDFLRWAPGARSLALRNKRLLWAVEPDGDEFSAAISWFIFRPSR